MSGVTAQPDPFPDGFFDRQDEAPDSDFYSFDRLVTHIDAGAIAAVGALYAELEVEGRLLDLMSSWISHLPTKPEHLTVLGMNGAELAANEMADETVVHDLNANPNLPFGDASFDAAMCVVSVDYLTRPLEVFSEVARVLTPGGLFICTFSNRCFPNKAIRGWLSTGDDGHCAIVSAYFRRSRGWGEPTVDVRVPPGFGADPLYAVWAHKT